jgi:apolipoprotein D and lipocalin family protein
MRFLHILALASAFTFTSPTLADTVNSVDLSQYLGEWYEIRRIANEFQDNELEDGFGACGETRAEYSALAFGRISVTNTCTRYNNANQSFEEVAEGVARVVRGSNNSKLKVNFTGLPFLRWFGIGDGDYWIYALGPVNAEGQYSWSLVGSSEFEYGWILARDPNISDDEIEQILAIAEEKGFDITRFLDRM